MSQQLLDFLISAIKGARTFAFGLVCGILLDQMPAPAPTPAPTDVPVEVITDEPKSEPPAKVAEPALIRAYCLGMDQFGQMRFTLDPWPRGTEMLRLLPPPSADQDLYYGMKKAK